MVTEHVVERTLNVLFVLLRALTQLVQVERVLLLELRVHVLGIVCTRCPLIAVCVLSGVCQAVRRLRCHLHFSPG